MFERIHQMIVKEFLHTLRDPRARGVVIVAPVIQLLLFGYAVSTDVRNLRLGVYDNDNSIESRDLVARFVNSGYFQLEMRLNNPEEMKRYLDSGALQMALWIDHGFGARMASGKTADLQVILDGSDSNTARVAVDYVSRIVRDLASQQLRLRMQRLYGPVELREPVILDSRAWFNDNLESRNFYVPGVIATLITVITLMLTSMAIVREKELGTLEQLIATPIRQFEFILGKTIPFVLIGYLDVILIVCAGIYWFEVPMRGNLFFLLTAVGLFLMSTIGIGLIISTLSQTQQQAIMSTFLFFNPAMLLSGFVFPIPNMPEPVQWITYLNPLRYMLIIVRSVFLKGVGFEVLWPEILGLLLLGVFTLAFAVSRMKKTLA